MTINDSLKSKRDSANKLVQEILSIKNNVNSIKIDAEALYRQIESKDKDYKKLIQSLNRINSTTDEAINNFRSERDRIKVLLTQVNNFYEKKYLPLSQKIEDENTGFRAKINKSNKELRELEKIKLSCSKQYDEIKKSVIEYKIKQKELSTLNTKIRKLAESADNNKKKSDSHLIKVQAAEREIQVLLGNSKKRDSETFSLEKVIKKRALKTQELAQEIERLYVESEVKRKEIQDVYEISHETGLSGEYEKRRNALNKALNKWEKRIFWSSIFLLIGIVALFIFQLKLYNWNIETHNFDLNFYVRFLILSPAVYYLVFCSREYNKINKLHDKYSFKTTLAMTIKSHIELLTNVEAFKTEERQDKVMNFIMEGFEKIYSEPYDNDNFKMKLQLSNLKLELEKSILEKLSINNEK